MKKMMMNKKRVKASVFCGVITTALVAGSVAGHSARPSYALAEEKKVETKEDKTAKEQTVTSKVSKEETVYAVLDNSGKVEEVIVSDWLKNVSGKEDIKDSSELEDIMNTKGEETFLQEGDDITWKANGKDIYYQGSTTKELPVSMQISYELDGKSVSAKELSGKSGKLTMTIHYENHTKDANNVSTPFVMVTGMILPVENFSNVTVDKGYIASEGNNTILVAYGMPGLKESLDLDGISVPDDAKESLDKIKEKFSDTVTICADVTDFAMKQTYTVASNELFEHFDTDTINSTEDLDKDLDEITDASVKLVDGTSELNDGIETLDDKFGEYKDGVKQLNDGQSDLFDGTLDIKNGVDAYTKNTDLLVSKIGKYTDGVKKVANGTKDYTKYTGQLVDAIGLLNDNVAGMNLKYGDLSAAINTYVDSSVSILSAENMSKLSQGAGALKSGVANINSGLKKAKQGVSTLNDKSQALKKTDELEQVVAALKGMKETETDAGKKAALSGAISYIEGGENAAAVISAITNGSSDGDTDNGGQSDLLAALSTMEQATSDEADNSLYSGAAAMESSVNTMSGYAKQLRDNAPALKEGNSQMKNGVKALADGSKKINDSGKQIVSKNKELVDGTNALISNGKLLKSKSKQLTAASPKLRKGAKDLSDGASKLKDGVSQIFTATGSVSDGIKELKDGASKIKDGMSEFKEEAVDKITETIRDMTDGLGELRDKVDEVKAASKEYRSFSGISDTMDGNVKFIMTTKEITNE
ncbi:MAG: hypothetical protein K6G65_00635 [Lachnospiraceae bacterium]|nr:hypothetical protein [Lachnospiraceae bacterium]